MKKHELDLDETCLSSETIASGGMLTVKRDQVRIPSGKTSQREYVVHPGAVVVVPLLANDHVVLERQFRYPLHQVFIELPAGKIDPGESVLETGKRELLEETGYSGGHWVALGLQHPCIGYSNEVIHMYLARDLQLGLHRRDDDEAMEIMTVPFQDVMRMIFEGHITDGKTIIAMMLADHYLKHNG